MKKSRLSLDNRINLQAGIEKGLSLKQIAEIVHCNRSTIYREILNNCRIIDCQHSCAHCSKQCGKRGIFVENCLEFSIKQCERWKHFPYTCNGCKNKAFCRNFKRYYDCSVAQDISEKNRKLPRSHKRISKEALQIIDEIIYQGIKINGQSLHHCYVSNPKLWSLACERSIRRFIYNGYFRTKAFDLPRYVRYVHKYDYTNKKVINVERMLCRTYTDFLNYVKEHENVIVWEYDSVEGKINDKKAILTITHPKTRFQFGILITKQSKASVVNKIRELQKKLGDKYSQIFMVNLSDNGPEFSSFHEIEYDENGVQICKVFFTNPYKSTDKPHCERNHEFIRYVIPKGESLNFLTQEKVNLLFSHINSYVRASNQNKTPYELIVESFGLEFIQATGITAIPLQDVCLKRELLK